MFWFELVASLKDHAPVPNTKTASTLLSEFADAGYFPSLQAAVGRDAYRDIYLPVAYQVASRIQEAPLSQAAFRELGGALQCALRSALLAVRMCDKTVFSQKATADQRQTEEPLYRWLAFCATLATTYLISVSNVVVLLSETGEIYSHASHKALPDLSDLPVAYELKWRQADTAPSLNQRLFTYLGSFWFQGMFEHLSHTLVCDLSAAINPSLTQQVGETPLARLVRQAVERTISDDIAARGKSVGSVRVTIGETPSEDPKQAPSTEAQEASQSGADHEDSTTDRKEATKKEDEDSSPAAIKAREWLAALATVVDLDDFIKIHPDGHIELARKALGFGASASDNYKMLHEAKAVDKKNEKSVELSMSWSSVYIAARAKRGS